MSVTRGTHQGRLAALALGALVLAVPRGSFAQTLDYFPQSTFQSYVTGHIGGRTLQGLPGSRAPAADAGAPGATTYAGTPEVARRTVSAFLERLGRTDPAAARQVGAQLTRQDYRAVWREMFTRRGLREDDALDALTALVGVGWVVANGGAVAIRDPAALRGLRAQLGAAVASGDAFRSPARRAATGEELKLLAVVLAVGFQGARQAGTAVAYSDGVWRMLREGGFGDLRAMRITTTGLVSR